jgi:hypothetical protein
MRTSAIFAFFMGLFFVAGTASAGEKGKIEATGAGSIGTEAASETSGASQTAAASGPASTSVTQPQPTAPTGGEAASPPLVSEGGAAATPLPSPPPVSVCSLINCSGHGLCIEQDGKPMCACNEGYTPDSVNGLSCLPYTQIPSVSAAASRSVQDLEREAALMQFYSVLPNYPVDRDYVRFTRIKDYGRYSGSFPDYMAERFHGQKAGGIAVTAIGGALTVAATLFLVIGTNEDTFIRQCSESYMNAGDYSCDDRQTLFLVFGNVFAVASITLYSIGIPKLALGSSRLKKINRIRNVKPDAISRIGNLHLSFSQGDRLDTHGLVAGFDF